MASKKKSPFIVVENDSTTKFENEVDEKYYLDQEKVDKLILKLDKKVIAKLMLHSFAFLTDEKTGGFLCKKTSRSMTPKMIIVDRIKITENVIFSIPIINIVRLKKPRPIPREKDSSVSLGKRISFKISLKSAKPVNRGKTRLIALFIMVKRSGIRNPFF